jgi:glutamate formiminotransferase
VLECVINVSEGRRSEVIAAVAGAAGDHLLDVHSDTDHHRSVLTLGGPAVEAAARAVATAAIAQIDLRQHTGVHPRLGAIDVVPFVPLDDAATWVDAVQARDRFARWVADELGVPAFVYGEERTLPDVRRRAFRDLAPDAGPGFPHPTAGAVAVGARWLLVAYNLELAVSDLATARAIAASIRSDHVRALGLAVGDVAQVSCNLIAPAVVGPDAVYDAVAARAEVARAELVGLVPATVLAAIPRHRWPALDLDPSRTIEARLSQAGLDGGSGVGPISGRGR